MNKHDLYSGLIVVLRNNEILLVSYQNPSMSARGRYLINDNTVIHDDLYRNDLTHKSNPLYDICEIYQPEYVVQTITKLHRLNFVKANNPIWTRKKGKKGKLVFNRKTEKLKNEALKAKMLGTSCERKDNMINSLKPGYIFKLADHEIGIVISNDVGSKIVAILDEIGFCSRLKLVSLAEWNSDLTDKFDLTHDIIEIRHGSNMNLDEVLSEPIKLKEYFKVGNSSILWKEKIVPKDECYKTTVRRFNAGTADVRIIVSYKNNTVKIKAFGNAYNICPSKLLSLRDMIVEGIGVGNSLPLCNYRCADNNKYVGIACALVNRQDFEKVCNKLESLQNKLKQYNEKKVSW